ncbi:MAG: xanthine dehydrogenase family protein molybdopterin-binding subunit [Thermoleophilia bacterium]
MNPPVITEQERAQKELAVVGKPIPKADAGVKVTGQAQYMHDLELPGMLYAKILYSDRPSGRIVSIDTSEADRIPGVKAVITAYNTPEIRFGFLKDNTALKKDRVRQYRDEVAAVAATTPELAEAAIKAIKVAYEDLPAVFDPAEAMKEGAPLVHELNGRGEPNKDNRLRLPWKLENGDIEAGEAASAFIAEGEYETGWVTHCCLGTAGCVALFDPDDNLTMYSVTQIPSLAKADFQEAMKAMGVRGKVRVVLTTLGGGFGSKLDTYAFEYIAMLLAHRTKKPVKILFDREEEFFATSPRQPARIKIRQGCDAEGNLTFRDTSMILDNGAYTSWGATTPTVMMMPASSLYQVENVRFRATCVYTNNTYAQAMRGYGTPQMTFALECNMDELAEMAGIDGYEFRLKNANVAGTVTPQGFKVDNCGHVPCLEAVAERLDWDGYKAAKAQARAAGARGGDVDAQTPPSADEVEATHGVGPVVRGELTELPDKVRGIGMACLMHVGGGAKIYKSDGCGTLIKVDDLGYVDVYSGSMDMGQGLDTILRQIVAETLGLTVDRINVVIGDTDVCPWDAGAHASRSTFVAGNSGLYAAQQVREQILNSAAEILDTPRDGLDLEGGLVVCALDPEKTTKIEKVLRKAHFASAGNTMFMAAYFYEPPTDLLAGDFKGNYSMAYAWGCHGVEVEVDRRTGQIDIVRYIAAHDVGKAINPLLLRGQILGGGLQGIGFALAEEMIFEEGKLLNPNFRDYKMLTALDSVAVEPVLVEDPAAAGPYGAKGIGEPGLVPTAPAIANAIYDAVGIRLKKLPMKPEMVLQALMEREGR